jgi:hypothetical protein
MPLAVKLNRLRATNSSTNAVARTIRRLGTLSAIRPPNNPSATTGPNSASPTRPSANGSSVSVRTSHATATVWSHALML